MISSSWAVEHSGDEIFQGGDKVDNYNEFDFTNEP